MPSLMPVAQDTEGRVAIWLREGLLETSDGFRAEWHKVTKKAKIAAITGHTLREVRSMLEAYFGRDPELAESAIRKLDEHSQRTGTANRAACGSGKFGKSL